MVFRCLLALKSRDDDLKSVLRTVEWTLARSQLRERFIETNGAFRVVYVRSSQSYAFLRQPMANVLARSGTLPRTWSSHT